MSDTTTARKLEADLRAALAPLLPAVSVRIRNEPVPADPNACRIPAIVIAAAKRGDYLSVKQGKRYGELLDLSIGCRAEDDRAIEALAASLADALKRVSGLSGWLYLRIEPDGEERGFDGHTRTIALKFSAYCLTTP